jgi:hypothetical protein
VIGITVRCELKEYIIYCTRRHGRVLRGYFLQGWSLARKAEAKTHLGNLRDNEMLAVHPRDEPVRYSYMRHP